MSRQWRYQNAGTGRGMAGNKEEILAREGQAAGGRIARPAPLVDEDGRAATGHGIRPVPVKRKNKVVKRIGPAKAFRTGAEGAMDQMVVGRVFRVIAPSVFGPDRNGPGGQACGSDAIGPEEKTNDPVTTRRRPASPFALVTTHSAAADADRKHPPPVA